MNPKETDFIETPLATPLYNPGNSRGLGYWQAYWRRWRFVRRKVSKLQEEIDDVLR
jgi:hypothetical protein